MRLHQVEVDEEVFSFVKEHAEPLVDDFNSALRRLLPLGASTTSRPTRDLKAEPAPANSQLPEIPRECPQALRQILEVVHLVFSGAYGRIGATNYVAKRHGVCPQTVQDKYGRQLDLRTSRFDGLLEPEKRPELLNILLAKFPEHTEAINSVFK